MPDRQRHSRLSDGLARLFTDRFRKARLQESAPPAPAGRRRAAAPQEPAQAGFFPGPQNTAGGPPRPPDPWDDTMQLSRVAWEPSDLHGREADRPDPTADTTLLGRVPREPSDPWESKADRPDPWDDTTLLSRVTLSQPPAGPNSDAGTGLSTEASTDTETGAVTETSAGDDGGPTEPWSLRSFTERHRRRLAMGGAGIVVIGALLALPPVRAQLRDSFTKLPKPYTALYFTSPPQVDGTVLTVPVSVHAVDTGTDTYSVRVWTVDAKGKVDDSRTADLAWDGQAMSAVVSMPVNPAADIVWVSLGGSDQTLHYKIAVA